MPTTTSSPASSLADRPALPASLRVVRTISRTLLGAVLECERVATAATARTHRRAAPLAVKTVSLKRAAQLAKASASNRKVDDPWQEWRVAQQLIARGGGHHHLLQFYQHQLADDGETMVFTTEYCGGGDLFELVESTPTGTIPEPQALALLRQVVLGVQYLHTELKLAHRDLSLENVLLRDGVCKLSDFGLSTTATQRCTECAGKEYYMAPEVVAAGEDSACGYDPRAADVWSLGIMLLILLTGSPLLPVASRVERGFTVLATHGVAPVLSAWGVRDQLTDACVALLARMLQVDANRLVVKQLHELTALRQTWVVEDASTAGGPVAHTRHEALLLRISTVFSE